MKDDLHEWKGVKLVTIPSPKKKSFEAIIHTFRAIHEAKQLGADVLHIHAIGPDVYKRQSWSRSSAIWVRIV